MIMSRGRVKGGGHRRECTSDRSCDNYADRAEEMRVFERRAPGARIPGPLEIPRPRGENLAGAMTLRLAPTEAMVGKKLPRTERRSPLSVLDNRSNDEGRSERHQFCVLVQQFLSRLRECSGGILGIPRNPSASPCHTKSTLERASSPGTASTVPTSSGTTTSTL